jgi:hypothetical protein
LRKSPVLGYGRERQKDDEVNIKGQSTYEDGIAKSTKLENEEGDREKKAQHIRMEIYAWWNPSVQEIYTKIKNCSSRLFFLAVLGLELRTSGLLGRQSYCLSHSTIPSRKKDF